MPTRLHLTQRTISPLPHLGHLNRTEPVILVVRTLQDEQISFTSMEHGLADHLKTLWCFLRSSKVYIA